MLASAAGALFLACSDEERSGDDEPPDLAAEALPLLSCAAAVQTEGECARDADCSASRCVLDVESQPQDRGPLELFCGQAQGTGKARSRCDEGADCESGLCGLAGVCLAPCTESSDCELGQTCLRAEVRLGERGLAPVMACVRNTAFPSSVSLALGPAPTRVSDLRGINLTLPGRTDPALWYFRSACPSLVQIQALKTLAPARSLYELSALLSGEPTLNPVINMGPLVPLLLPNNPALFGLSADVQVSIAVGETTRIDTFVAFRGGRRSVLDLNLFYVGAGADDEVGGFHPGNTRVAAMISSLRTLYRDIGITLGEVREYDVVGALRDELSVLDVEVEFDENDIPVDLALPELGRLFELSSGVEDGGLNLFLLREMGDVLGIAGGIPGALGVHGTSESGVAIAFDVLGAAEAPLVAMHELSHQMGLFHTSEFDGSSIEPIDDTEVCGPGLDRDGDGVLSASECRNRGGDNLMFWGGSGRALSPQQTQLLGSSLILR